MNADDVAPRIRVLVVEDSPTVRDLLVHVLDDDPSIRVIGTAADGAQAVAAVQRTRPDVITMDVHMPHMDGLEATRRIMETVPTPIVIVSGSLSRKEVALTFSALQAGALAVIGKPSGLNGADGGDSIDKLVQTVKLMAEVKVVRRWHRSAQVPIAPAPVPMPRRTAPVRIVVIGASTGGPQALHAILDALPRNFLVPIVIVQHIAVGFTEGLAEWLAQSCRRPVQLARHGEPLLGGQVYIAPEGTHTTVTPDARIALTHEAPENGHRPSVSCLFRSAAVLGAGAIGVLLTGMGKDGARELRLMLDHGAMTIVQDPDSAVVSGMPGEAIALGAATQVLATERIAAALGELANDSVNTSPLTR